MSCVSMKHNRTKSDIEMRIQFPCTLLNHMSHTNIDIINVHELLYIDLNKKKDYHGIEKL